ncbi:MAG TPA: LPS export ABC transporter permease LptF [Candidatus Binatia bacterium]|nr:LPS export ABC transporter permease LptF [Candidatus Binatia bacterium]
MRIVDRYILRELAVPFVLGLGIFTSVLLIVRILKLVEMVVNRGVPLLQVLKLFSYILPGFLEVTVPMALLLAILVAFGRLSSDSEVIAMRASGIGLYRLFLPVGVFATAVAVMTLGLSVYVRPWGNFLLRTGLYEIVKARASAGIKSKVFNDDFAGLVIYVDRIEPPGNQLFGVLISDLRDPRQHNTVYARSGLLQTSEDSHAVTLRLYEGGMFSAPSATDGYQDTRFSTYDITLDLDLALADARSRPKDASEMGLGELRRTIAAREADHETSFAEQVELHRKFSIPFGCLVFAALGVPLGIQPTRAVHSRGFSVSLLLIFAYYLLLTLGQNLGERGALRPPIAVWLPNLSLSLVAAMLLRRAASDSGPSQPALFDRSVSLLRSRWPRRAS